jgi:hypothetical protein
VPALIPGGHAVVVSSNQRACKHTPYMTPVSGTPHGIPPIGVQSYSDHKKPARKIGTYVSAAERKSRLRGLKKGQKGIQKLENAL